MVNFPVFLFLAVGAMALFTFLAVAVYVDNRTKERATYHRYETLKKLAESSSDSAARVLELMREDDRLKRRRMIEGLKLAGLIVAALGLALTFFLFFLDADQPRGVFLAGLIPLFIGLAMLLYSTVLASPGGDRPEGPRDP